eukprot:scaffold10.g2393.t1
MTLPSSRGVAASAPEGSEADGFVSATSSRETSRGFLSARSRATTVASITLPELTFAAQGSSTARTDAAGPPAPPTRPAPFQQPLQQQAAPPQVPRWLQPEPQLPQQVSAPLVFDWGSSEQPAPHTLQPPAPPAAQQQEQLLDWRQLVAPPGQPPPQATQHAAPAPDWGQPPPQEQEQGQAPDWRPAQVQPPPLQQVHRWQARPFAAIPEESSVATFSLQSLEQQVEAEAGKPLPHPLAYMQQGPQPEQRAQPDGKRAAGSVDASSGGKGGATGRVEVEARAGPATAALRKRHARQLRKTDRDQFGVPVPATARPFSPWASPFEISEACTGESLLSGGVGRAGDAQPCLRDGSLGVYLASLRSLILLALLLSICAIYPLVDNIQMANWDETYTLVVGGAAGAACAKGYPTSSWITDTTIGGHCHGIEFSSRYDCAASCVWNSSRLAADARPQASSPAAPDGPCYCCDLQLDAAAAEAAPRVAAGQLWMLVLRCMHAADARVVTASDYCVRIAGLKDGRTDDPSLRAWCSHYGGVVAALAIPSIGDTLRLGRRVEELQVCHAESAALRAAPCCWFWGWVYRLAAVGGGHRAVERRLERARHKLAVYERQPLEPTGTALAIFSYADEAAACIEDHWRPLHRRLLNALTLGCLADAPPRLHGARVRVTRAPEPTDFQWGHTSCTGSAALLRRAWSATLTGARGRAPRLGARLMILGSAAIQYGLALAAEHERASRLAWERDEGEVISFESFAAFTSSLAAAARLRWLAALSGLSIVIFNYLLTLAVHQLSVYERWHTRSSQQCWLVVKLSLAFLLNSVGAPILAAALSGNTTSWYSKGGLAESAFYTQVANALLPPLVTLLDPLDSLCAQLLARAARTQGMLDRLMQPPEFPLAEAHASAITTLGMGLFYAPMLPMSPMLASIGLALQYAADKHAALRRATAPGNLSGRVAAPATHVLRLLPLVQLLLMRFLYFEGYSTMPPAFWTGLAFWLAFLVAPLRGALGLVPRRRATSTGRRSWRAVLGCGRRGGPDDEYMPAVPAPCSAAFRACVRAAFTPPPLPLPPADSLLPRQQPGTGAAPHSRGGSRDASADLEAEAPSAPPLEEGEGAASRGAGGSAASASVSGPLRQPQAQARQQPPGHFHAQHARRGSWAAQLGTALSSSLAQSASWLWTPLEAQRMSQQQAAASSLWSYDWRRAADSVDTAAAAGPRAPPPA